MQHATAIQNIRLLVRQTLVELRAADADDVRESILIREGHYCGRRFVAQGFQLVWFCEENELKVYDADGKLKSVLHGREFASSEISQARAA